MLAPADELRVKELGDDGLRKVVEELEDVT